MLKIRKITAVDCPVWENGEMTNEKESRVMVVFEEQGMLNGLAAGGMKVGTLFMAREVTLEQAETALPLDFDYSGSVRLVQREGSTWYKAVIGA